MPEVATPAAEARTAAAHAPAAHDDWLFSVVVGLVALLPRLFVAIAWAREPVWDGHYYHFGAERIAKGLGYSEDVIVNGHALWKPWAHYPVGYSGLLAGAYRIFGSSLVVAPIVNAIIGTLLVIVVHRLGRYYLGTNRARVAAGITALHPGLIAYCAVVMTEPLAALLLMAAALCALRWRGQWLGVVLAGLTLGLAVLVRPSALLAAPLIALTQPKPAWQALLRGALVTAIAFVVVVPWSLRICRVMDGCAFVSTNGGWNLAIGAITRTGRFTTLHASDGCPVVTGQVEQDRCWAKVGEKIILAHPWHWIGMMPKKLAENFDHESFAIEYLHEADPITWPERRRVAGRGLLTLFHRLLMVVAALGVVALADWRNQPQREWLTQLGLVALVCGLGLFAFLDLQHPFYLLVVLTPLIGFVPLPGRPRQEPVGWYLLGLIAVTALTHAVFFGDDRYHLLVTPVLCLLAAAALRPSRAAAKR
jgi:4-amino-4-deoxy-L-arabinose transferase-like glycosyltransferase